jgi:hypothetical protein
MEGGASLNRYQPTVLLDEDAKSTTSRRRRPQTVLSGYQRSMAPNVEHMIPLAATDPTEKNARSWAQLWIHSFAPSEGQTPLFHPGDEVTGFVELDLQKQKCIGEIRISVRIDAMTFLTGYSSDFSCGAIHLTPLNLGARPW